MASKILSGEYAGGRPFAARTGPLQHLRDQPQRVKRRVFVAKPRVGTIVRGRDQWNLLDADLLGWSLAR